MLIENTQGVEALVSTCNQHAKNIVRAGFDQLFSLEQNMHLEKYSYEKEKVLSI